MKSKTTVQNGLNSLENTLDELTNQLKGIKVNAELFNQDENLDELDNIEDDEKKDNGDGEDKDA